MNKDKEILNKVEEAVQLLGGMAKVMKAKCAKVLVENDGSFSLTFEAPDDGELDLSVMKRAKSEK